MLYTIRQKWLTLGSLWCHFGITLMSLWGHFGIISGSLCGHFGVTLGLHFLWSWECMDLSTWLMAVDPYPWTPTWAHGWQVHGSPVSFFFYLSLFASAGITKWNQFLPSRRESRSEINCICLGGNHEVKSILEVGGRGGSVPVGVPGILDDTKR